jgi:hypothetical protein
MKNFKWGTTSFDSSPIHVVLFVSRNKDNKDIENFTERRMSFITHEDMDSEELKNKFEDFVNHGVPNELSRMYYSVNERNGEKIYKEILHFLIDNPNFNLCSIMPKIAGIAAKKECALTKHWMFDFDLKCYLAAVNFCKKIKEIDKDINITIHSTPHGYAIVTDRGFDCRELLKKYEKYVTLKRDDLLCVKWKKKNN